jgi:hypothetical protein
VGVKAAIQHQIEQQKRAVFWANRPRWVDQMRPRDIIVGGLNYGMGSSRPAARSLGKLGIAALIAESLHGLFFRNAVNNGLLALVIVGGRPLTGALSMSIFRVRQASAILRATPGAVMVGGDEPVFGKYRPLLAAMAGNIFYVGGAGAGCVAKLVTQYLGYTNFVAALEGMLIGAKAGIDLGVLARIVPLSAGASRTFDNIPRSVLSGAFTAGGTLDIVAKDLHLACDLAREVAAPAQLGLRRMTC